LHEKRFSHSNARGETQTSGKGTRLRKELKYTTYKGESLFLFAVTYRPLHARASRVSVGQLDPLPGGPRQHLSDGGGGNGEWAHKRCVFSERRDTRASRGLLFSWKMSQGGGVEGAAIGHGCQKRWQKDWRRDASPSRQKTSDREQASKGKEEGLKKICMTPEWFSSFANERRPSGERGRSVASPPSLCRRLLRPPQPQPEPERSLRALQRSRQSPASALRGQASPRIRPIDDKDRRGGHFRVNGRFVELSSALFCVSACARPLSALLRGRPTVQVRAPTCWPPAHRRNSAWPPATSAGCGAATTETTSAV